MEIVGSEVFIAFIGLVGTIITVAAATWKVGRKHWQDEVKRLNERIEKAHERELDRMERQAGVLERVREFMDTLSQTGAEERSDNVKFQAFVTTHLEHIKQHLEREGRTAGG